MKDRLNKVFKDCIGLELENLDPNASMHDIPEWDSMAHMTFITEVEQEFSCDLEAKEIMEMTSPAKISGILSKKID